MRGATRAPLRAKRRHDVVNHYDVTFGLALTEQEKADLVEFLKSL